MFVLVKKFGLLFLWPLKTGLTVTMMEWSNSIRAVSRMMYKLACLYTEDSNQSAPAYMSLIFLPEEMLDSWLPIEQQKKESEQTASMCRLI